MIAAKRAAPWRVALAFALAPAVPAAVAGASIDGRIHPDWFSAWQAYAVIGGYFPTLVLGLPMWFALRHRITPGFGAAMIAGGVISALPWALLGMPFAGIATFILGGRMQTGWVNLVQDFSLLIALGALGGVVFRVIAYGWRR